eukprot:4273555-Alexandrium_andersonii.AAC.1
MGSSGRLLPAPSRLRPHLPPSVLVHVRRQICNVRPGNWHLGVPWYDAGPTPELACRRARRV